MFLITARNTRKTLKLTRFGFGEKFVIRIGSSLPLNNKARQFISVSQTIVQDAPPKKIQQRRNTVADTVNTNQKVESCNLKQQSDTSNYSEKVVKRRKSIAFNPSVKVYDLMYISKKNIPSRVAVHD